MTNLIDYDEPKFRYTAREWRPILVWEEVYRTEVNGRMALMCPEEEVQDTAAMIKIYAEALQIEVSITDGKLIYEDDEGDKVADMLIVRPHNNEKAERYASAETEAEKRAIGWFPIRMGEAIYRQEQGKSIYYLCDHTDNLKALRHAQSAASRLKIKVQCRLAKLLERIDDKDRITRLLIITPLNNPAAAHYAEEVKAGRINPYHGGPITPQYAESYFNPKAMDEAPKRRGRPPKPKA